MVKEKIYQKMREMNPNYQNAVITVLDRDCLGEKALVSDHRLVWESQEGGICSAHEEEVCRLDQTGAAVVGGHTLFCEILGHEKRMVICGGGHVSIPLIRMGRMIGCTVTVLEDRPKFADNARRAGADEVVCETFADGLERIEGDRDTFFIIVTRGHRYDQVCLEAIVRKEHAYIGMIGSRKRVGLVKEAVIARGGDPGVVHRVYTPIGLKIGAETPEEIAVSIMAEVIEVKNKKKGNGGYSRELLKAIMDGYEKGEKRVLATIVGRKGSAPRGVGTKMLVFPDGTCVGTIGGGCVESDIYRKALLMLRGGRTGAKLCHVDMTGRDAEEEGMVCGGFLDILLEVV